MRGVAFGDILFASSGKKYVKNSAKTKVLEITEAPPAADEARRFRGSVPIGGHEVAGHADSTTQSFPAKGSFHVKNSPIL